MFNKKVQKFWIKTANIIPRTFNKGLMGKTKEFFSRFSKAILTMIAVLPAAGLLITLGKVIGPLGLGQIQATSIVFNKIGQIIETVGWLPFTHLGLLFAIAIGGSWSKERAGGAFAGALAYFTLLAVGSTFFVMQGEGEKQEFMNFIIGGRWTPIDGYFRAQQGVLSLSFGALGGIITGFIGAGIYNKFHKFDKLPAALSFFNGARFVPFMVFIIMLPIAIMISLFWPLFQAGLNILGKGIVNQQNIPFIMPFSYGFLERILLPLGLHHMITIPMNYTEAGGQLDFLANPDFKDFFTWAVNNNLVEAKTLKAEGQEYMWFTWISALGVVKNNYEAYVAASGTNVSLNVFYDSVLNSFAPVRFKVGQMISSTGSLLGASLGMWYVLPKANRTKYYSIYIGAALSAILTGVTETVEFIFLFTAPLLYLGHAVLTGVAFGLSDFIPMRIHAFGGLETIIRYFALVGPSTVNTGNIKSILWLDGLWFLLTSAGFAGLYFGFFYTGTKLLKPAIPGMLIGADDSLSEEDTAPPDKNHNSGQQKNEAIVKETQIDTIITLLGGADNIQEVDACMTRLRITVYDANLIINQFQEKAQAIGVVLNGNSIQIIYGPQASVLKEKVKTQLGI